MLRQNRDLDLLRNLFLYAIDLLETERERNDIQDQQLRAIYQKVGQLEEREQDRKERLEFLEAEIPALRYRVDRSIELEYLEHPYSSNGEPRCNW